jgi:tetratricopeptide (TPR) repeat protein
MRIAHVLITTFLLTAAWSTTALVEADDEPAVAQDVAKARALIEQGKHEQAMDLLVENLTDDRLENEIPFMLTLADAAIGHAPDVPILNGGDGIQKRLYSEAGKLYRRVREMDAATNAQKVHAIAAINRVMKRIDAAINAGWKTETWGKVLLQAELMIAFAPGDIFGPEAILDLADELDDPGLRLYGMREFVKTKPEDTGPYRLAAMLEADTENRGEGLDAALKHIESGLAVMPGNLVLSLEQINYLTQLKRGEDAYAKLKQFEIQLMSQIENAKERAVYVVSAGKLYEGLGKTEQAVSNYRRSLRSRPDLLEAHYLLGTLLVKRAIDALLAATDPDTRKPDNYDALIASSKADFAAARPHLEYYHANAERHNLAVMEALVTIYERAGEMDKFVKMKRDMDKVQRGEPIR